MSHFFKNCMSLFFSRCDSYSDNWTNIYEWYVTLKTVFHIINGLISKICSTLGKYSYILKFKTCHVTLKTHPHTNVTFGYTSVYLPLECHILFECLLQRDAHVENYFLIIYWWINFERSFSRHFNDHFVAFIKNCWKTHHRSS